MKTIQEIAQWVIDNRYPKSENDKVSDFEMYHTLIEAMNQVLRQPLVSGRSEQLKAFREWTRENLTQEDIISQTAIDRYLESL